MSELVVIRIATLSERHLRPGRTKHTTHDKRGSREFPPFVSLVITDETKSTELIMWRFCENGEAAHTHHDTLEDAFHQAEFEFEVMRTEWVETNEPFDSLKGYAEKQEFRDL
jgi:hypothetical protein